MKRHKTVVFGLDGACFDLVEPWLGSLPTLSELIDRGGRAPLESCVPATTPAWTTMTTGVNPGKHGIFGFYDRHRDSYDIYPVSDRTVHARRLWDYTTEADLTSLVVDVPVTHPARPLNGVLVPGYLAPEDPQTYPESALADVDHDDYRVYALSEVEDVPDEQLLEEWLTLSRSRADLATSLMDAHDWDLLFLKFQKTDGAVHKFDDDAKIRVIYECVDDCMARVLEAVDEPVNVVVVSDHGIGQPKEWTVALNTWLRDEGYLRTTTGERVNEGEWLNDAVGESGANSDDDAGGIGTALTNVGFTRQRIEGALSAIGLYEVARRLAPGRLKPAVGEATVDWAASRTFYETPSIADVTPALLHLLDCPLDRNFDGHVLRPLLATERSPLTRSYGSYEPGGDYQFSDAERESLEDRLQQMGYLK